MTEITRPIQISNGLKIRVNSYIDSSDTTHFNSSKKIINANVTGRFSNVWELPHSPVISYRPRKLTNTTTPTNFTRIEIKPMHSDTEMNIASSLNKANVFNGYFIKSKSSTTRPDRRYSYDQDNTRVMEGFISPTDFESNIAIDFTIMEADTDEDVDDISVHGEKSQLTIKSKRFHSINDSDSQS